jgi:hypothetical protein
MKWLGFVLMAVGLVGTFALGDFPLPMSVQWTDYGGPHADIHQTEFVPSAGLPMFFLFVIGLIVFLIARRKRIHEQPR